MFTALKMFEIVKIVPMIDTGLESGGLAAGWTHWTLDTQLQLTFYLPRTRNIFQLPTTIVVQFRQEQQIGLFLSFLIPKASQSVLNFA